jgi:hypothetical protein
MINQAPNDQLWEEEEVEWEGRREEYHHQEGELEVSHRLSSLSSPLHNHRRVIPSSNSSS